MRGKKAPKQDTTFVCQLSEVSKVEEVLQLFQAEKEKYTKEDESFKTALLKSLSQEEKVTK